jgi:ketosteroid isomerase-like protein
MMDGGATMATEADEWNKAFTSGSEELTRLYAEDAALFPPDQKMVRGKRAVESLWEGVLEEWTESKLKQAEKFQAGEFFVETGSWTAKFQGRPVEGKYLTVWKKEGGTYKIYRDMWNRDHQL